MAIRKDGTGKNFFFCKVSSCHVKQEMDFIQYMECTPPFDTIENISECLCLRQASIDEDDYTASFDVPSRLSATFNVGGCYELESLESMHSVIHFVLSNCGIHHVAVEKPWSHHRLYINRFYINLTVRWEREAFTQDNVP